MNDKVLLEAKDIKVYFESGALRKKVKKVLDGVSLTIHQGETLALVGESGCGKSSLGKAILGIYPVTAGEVFFDGERLTKENYDRTITEMQMIFQDPLSSLNPRMTVFDIIAEPMLVCKTCPKEELHDRVFALMKLVGLRRDLAYRYPHEFSGGQCQRIGIARALALEPRLIVCDEPVSALDVSIKAQIINMFGDIQKERNIAYLFITHDLLTVRYISHRIAVMYLGQIVELAETEDLFQNPLHPYTQALLSSIAVPDVDAEPQRIILEGEVPSHTALPEGCPFHTRCRYAADACKAGRPELKTVSGGHQVACLLTEKEAQ